jgi:hypothetical protein
MRDPASRPNPAEAAIEDTRQFLERYMDSETWRADHDIFWADMHATADEIRLSNLPDYAKHYAIFAVLEQAKKRRGKPTRSYRDHAIQSVAIKLVMQGYKPTRNDVTRDKDSASSIICQALRRLGEKLSEKSINAIVAKIPASSFIKHKVSPAFFEYLRESPDLVHLFESDPNAPDPVDQSGRPCAEKVRRLNQHDESAPRPYVPRP